MVRRVCFRHNLIGQPHTKRGLEPRKQFHAFQAAEPEVSVQQRRTVEHRQSPAAAQFLKQTTNNLKYACT